jgi:ABC-2 type transport system ATP-binding protein
VRGIRERGKTVFLTTHLMEEAERLCDRVAVIDRGRIVDIGPPAALVRRHCPDRTIVITTDDAKDDESLRAVPGVLRVTRAGSEVTLTGRGEELISSVIECVSERRIRVRDFRTVVPTLEDVFLTLTGHSVRQ